MRDPAYTILLIEHDEATRALYARELGREYRVFACPDEHEALALLHAHAICAVILEPGPAQGGWALLTTIKQTGAIRGIPVILCSTLDERKRGLELGASAYLVKPVLPAALLETVRRIVHQPG